VGLSSCLALIVSTGVAVLAPNLAGARPLGAQESVPPPSNTSPPVISGATQDGQPLSTTTGAWTTGAPPLTFTYRWERCTSSGDSCSSIAATNSSYTATAVDVGHEITVVVKATDSLGQSTPATAAAVGPISAPAPPSNTTPPTISGTPQDGQVMTVSTGSWASPDNLTYRYQWQRCGSTGTGCSNISAAQGASYTPLAADVAHQLTAVVSATDRERQTTPAAATPRGPVTAPPPPSNTALPQISGTTMDGASLTATTGSWSSPDPLTYRYQWKRCDSTGANCVAIVSSNSTYRLTALDVGHQVMCVVTATDREKQTATAAVTPVGPIAGPPPPSNSRVPSIAGVAQVGQALLVSDGSWSSPDALKYAYQWERCDSSGAGCAPVPKQTSGAYVLSTADLGDDMAVAVTATDSSHQTATATAAAIGPVSPQQPVTGIQKIQHVVIIMQENRSFDSYFGTYPGADGIPTGVCLPDPYNGGCRPLFHDTADHNQGGPHGAGPAIADIDGGKMDGFVAQAEIKRNCTPSTLGCRPCTTSSESACLDSVGYHNGADIPNYWTYASDYVLQDHMFEPNASWSQPQHLYMVSEWSALCTNYIDPFSCTNALDSPNSVGGLPELDQTQLYAWTDITYLLHQAGVSWGYYVDPGTQPDCDNANAMTCAPVQQAAGNPSIYWNPLPHFTDVHQDGQLGNVQPLNNFYAAASAGNLPAVSWIVPNNTVSEHPASRVSAGQTYVTGLINAVMQSSDWNSTAIFLSWDDWGGFYDHYDPPSVDQNGYGLRVPGLVISPYAKQGYIDHQVLSHDAYVKFIEDDFLGGMRLDPATDGRPDPRPDVRENASALGDLASDFNFAQSPQPPVILPVCPQTDLTPKPTC
jgi:phospholipase C